MVYLWIYSTTTTTTHPPTITITCILYSLDVSFPKICEHQRRRQAWSLETKKLLTQTLHIFNIARLCVSKNLFNQFFDNPRPVVAHWQMYSKVVRPGIIVIHLHNPVQPWLSGRLDSVIEWYMASLHQWGWGWKEKTDEMRVFHISDVSSQFPCCKIQSPSPLSSHCLRWIALLCLNTLHW